MTAEQTPEQPPNPETPAEKSPKETAAKQSKAAARRTVAQMDEVIDKKIAKLEAELNGLRERALLTEKVLQEFKSLKDA